MIRPSLLPLLLAAVSIGAASEPTSTAPLSRAHELSRFAVIDPAYDALALDPAPDLRAGAAAWLYGEAELESWHLRVLLQQTKAAQVSGFNLFFPGSVAV
ncbi:MAG: hypothetical protein ABI162_17870 [Luteolibacter sp.]